MWVKQTTAQLPGITDSTPLQMSMHIWIYWGNLLKFRLTSATALREKGHLGRWAGGGKLSPEGDRKLSGHRQLQTLKSSIKRTIDNTLMSYHSFYNNHREQNVQKRQRNCARRHDHHIIPGYWSGYQKYLAKSALCAENCASTSGSSLRSHLKQLQVRRTQMHSSQSSIVNGRPRKTWRHNLLIRCATRNPGILSETKVNSMLRGGGQKPDDVCPEEQTWLCRINSKNYLSLCLGANQIFLSHKHSILGQQETSRHTAPPIYCGFF